MNDTPRVLAAVLNWNGEQDTVQAVRALMAMNRPEVETLVLDNASRDESREFIAKECPETEIIETSGNLGYAGGNNVAFRLAGKRGAKYCLVLNNDVFVDPAMLDSMLEAMECDPRIAIAGPRVYSFDRPDERSDAGWSIDWRRWLFCHARPIDAQENPVSDVDFVPGCVMLVRMDFVDKHGGFDERYHLYCEDADLCVRARRAGFRCVEVAAARACHKGSETAGTGSPLKTYYGLRNRWLFISLHAPARNRILLRLQLIGYETGGQALRALGSALMGRREGPVMLRAIGCAIRDALLNRYGLGPDWLFAIPKSRA